MTRNACMCLCVCVTSNVEGIYRPSLLLRDLRDYALPKHSGLIVCYDFKGEIYLKSSKFITNRVVFERCEC